jgi:hypothetical protein
VDRAKLGWRETPRPPRRAAERRWGGGRPGRARRLLGEVAGNASASQATVSAGHQGHRQWLIAVVAGNGPFPATGCRPAPEAGGPCGDDQPAAPALQCLACDQKARPAEWVQRAADAASMVGGRVNPAGANRARPTMVSPIVTIWTTPFGNERVSPGWSRLRTCTVPTATPPGRRSSTSSSAGASGRGDRLCL